MRILHTKTTNIAMAPDALSDAINKYTEHTSVVRYPHEITPDDLKSDVVLYHNISLNLPDIPKQLIMYHSEPWMVDLGCKVKNKLVIAQYHATLPEYKGCTVVSNVIDYNDEIYKPKYFFDKIKIGYSPSNKGSFGNWHNKGYEETKAILDKLKKKYGDIIDVDIITDVPLKECLERKSECNIFIDEVITGSYHRSGLEALAMGKMTICKLSQDVKKVIINITGSNITPFIDVSSIDYLESKLQLLIGIDINTINNYGMAAREWMEKYWNPKDIIEEYINIFENAK